MHSHVNLVVIRGRDVDSAAIAVHTQAAARWKRLLQVVAETVGMPAPGEVFGIGALAPLLPIRIPAIDCIRTESCDYKENDENEPASSDSTRPYSGAVRLLILD